MLRLYFLLKIFRYFYIQLDFPCIYDSDHLSRYVIRIIQNSIALEQTFLYLFIYMFDRHKVG